MYKELYITFITMSVSSRNFKDTLRVPEHYNQVFSTTIICHLQTIHFDPKNLVSPFSWHKVDLFNVRSLILSRISSVCRKYWNVKCHCLATYQYKDLGFGKNMNTLCLWTVLDIMNRLCVEIFASTINHCFVYSKLSFIY